MPEVRITVGGRDFDVACQEGEEHFLQAAAQMLDAEASVLVDQIGRMPESRMLLMAGLMLADKTAGLDEQMKRLEDKLASQQAAIESGEGVSADVAPIAAAPAEDLSPILEAVALRTEALADEVEARAAAG